jgi:multicomponent K+:H+ antiporter subunit E
MRRLCPHPVLTLVLWAMWLGLNQTLAPGHLALGGLLGLAIPLTGLHLADGQWPRLRRPALIVRLALTVLYDIVVSNVDVALRVLGPEAAIRPGFVRVPLALTDEWAIASLAGIITMTPGTLTVDVARDGSHLLVHAFHLADEAALVTSIKSRYEAPLREIYR